MLKRGDFEFLLTRISYKSNFELRIVSAGDPVLRIAMRVPNARSNAHEEIVVMSQTVLPPLLSEDRAVQWIQAQVERLEVHESREWFLLDGRAVLDPHGGETR